MNQSELRNAIHKYGRTLHAMRSEEPADNVVAKQKFAKMNNELDNLTDEIAKQNIINQRPPMSWGEKNKNEDEQAEKFKMEYKSAFLKYLRKGIDNDLVELLSKNNDKSNLGLMLKSDAYGYAITADMNEIISNNMFLQKLSTFLVKTLICLHIQMKYLPAGAMKEPLHLKQMLSQKKSFKLMI